jgi:hypothetical protein
MKLRSFKVELIKEVMFSFRYRYWGVLVNLIEEVQKKILN